jgi:hypothetical protein
MTTKSAFCQCVVLDLKGKGATDLRHRAGDGHSACWLVYSYDGKLMVMGKALNRCDVFGGCAAT